MRERQLAVDRRRGRLTELLEALWREQVRMTHEKSAAATRRFAEIVTSCAQEVTACSTTEGSADTLTMRPTSDEATGMDVTRSAPRRTP